MAAPPTSVHDLPAEGGGRADRTRRLLDAALCALECIAEHDPRGVLLLGPGWRVEFASVAAGSLLVEFFGADPESGLPLELQRWLEHRSDRPHRRRRGGRELTVRRNGDVLLLEAVAQFVPVTARERDVLALLARGHTNQQIADRLGIAPSTIRTHLEHLYGKLHVPTRTEAVTVYFGVEGGPVALHRRPDGATPT